MKSIDLDALDPDYEPVPTRGKRGHRKFYYVRFRDGYNKSIGIHPAKVLNWRALERRYHELNEKWNEANAALWSSFKTVGRKQKKDEHKWIMADENLVINVSSYGGYSLEDSKRLAEELVKKPNSFGKYFVVKPEEGGAEVGRLLHRHYRLMRASSVYFAAFKKAIQDRLEVYKKQRLEKLNVWRGSAYYPEHVFVVQNEDRKYVITMTSGGSLTFHGGELVEFS